MSDHWGGGVATCEWNLEGGDFKKEFGQIITPAKTVGFSKWEDFIHIPFQTRDWDTDEVYFSTFKSVAGKGTINISSTKKAYKD